MKQIFKRLLSETPVFFKKVRLAGLSLTASGITITAISGIPEGLHYFASQAIWVGAVMAAIAQMACQDPNELK